jgi:sugar phosphate isomerase/epimerase
MDRRQFLQRTAGLTLGAVGGTSLLAACSSDADSGRETGDETGDETGGSGEAASVPAAFGVQLYTVRSLLEEDFVGTMEAVAEMGYDEVEFAGYYGRSPQEITDLLDRLDLAAPAAHVMPSDIRDSPQEVVDTAAAVGHDYVVCAYLTEADRGSLDAYRAIAGLLDDFGKRCADAGLQLAYHNHDFEFAPIDGTLPYDLLLQETDPERVQMELDLYWIRKAGYEAVDYFDRQPGRFPLVHVKDMGPDGGIVPVGDGQIDFQRIFAASDTAGLQHVFVEHDNPDAPLDSIRTSLNYLQDLASR